MYLYRKEQARLTTKQSTCWIFFDVETPEFIGHVGTQVKDVEIKPTPSLNEGISLKKMRGIK